MRTAGPLGSEQVPTARPPPLLPPGAGGPRRQRAALSGRRPSAGLGPSTSREGAAESPAGRPAAGARLRDAEPAAGPRASPPATPARVPPGEPPPWAGPSPRAASTGRGRGALLAPGPPRPPGPESRPSRRRGRRAAPYHSARALRPQSGGGGGCGGGGAAPLPAAAPRRPPAHPGPAPPPPAGPARSRRRIRGLYSRGAAQRGRPAGPLTGVAARLALPGLRGAAPRHRRRRRRPSPRPRTHSRTCTRRSAHARGTAAGARRAPGRAVKTGGRRARAERPRASRGEGARASEREDQNRAGLGGCHGPAGRVGGGGRGRARSGGWERGRAHARSAVRARGARGAGGPGVRPLNSRGRDRKRERHPFNRQRWLGSSPGRGGRVKEGDKRGPSRRGLSSRSRSSGRGGPGRAAAGGRGRLPPQAGGRAPGALDVPAGHRCAWCLMKYIKSYNFTCGELLFLWRLPTLTPAQS